MTKRITEDKWILYRHTNNFNLIIQMAVNLKTHAASISKEDRKQLLLELKNQGFYDGRNPEMPLDAISHRINTLEFFMFGYKHKIGRNKKFMFNPLGNLFLKNLNNKNKISKIFLTMLWGSQYPNSQGTDRKIQIYPWRLIFKLLHDERLKNKLFSFEEAYYVPFVKTINEKTYEELVKNILNLRKLSNEEIEKMFKKREHVLVNANYEWDYYLCKIFESAGIIEKEIGETICTLNQGASKTSRKLRRNVVKMNPNVESLYSKLEENYPFLETPLLLSDPQKLQTDIIRDIHNFYPKELLEEIGETIDDRKTKLLNMAKLIKKYSENHDGEEWDKFEEILEFGFNSFYNVKAHGIGGAGNTDIECEYITEKKKFAVEGKSTKNKLKDLNAGRLGQHRRLVGAKYTIVITPRYVPSIKYDIEDSDIVIILASTFSEYLYNHFDNDVREIDYMDFDKIIIDNLGTDVSTKIAELTLNKFASITSE